MWPEQVDLSTTGREIILRRPALIRTRYLPGPRRFERLPGSVRDILGMFPDILGWFQDILGRFPDILEAFKDIRNRSRGM